MQSSCGRYATVVEHMTVSRPVRLVPQPAQAIEFSCPLCGAVHAAYVFGTGQFKICRCAGCALTFSDIRFLGAGRGFSDRAAAVRSEGQHGELVSALDAETVEGPVLVAADSGDGIISLVGRRDMAIGL